ncbi:MAG: sigma-70 family RNA polymerase sigma factor [Planctomycetota bacterium]|nr:sigma-70 family RNA polymerase sigma factor [Planctomycetota bacterium]
MLDDPRSDEALIELYRCGDNTALDILVNRYYDRIGFFLQRTNPNNLEDIRQKIFLKVMELLRAGKFIPAGPGTFRSWLYETARNICHEEEREYAKQPKTLGKQLLDAIPSDLESTRPVEEIEETVESISAEAERILSTLSQEEQLLLRMVSEGKSYKEIQATEPFTKYTLPNLRRKACDIRKYLFKEVAKWKSKRNR